jgi:hypothetical protein
VVREAASWFCAAYGILGNLLYWAQHQRLNGLILLAFFLCAAAMIRNGQPRVAVVCVIAFFAIALVACGSFCLMLAPLPLLGSFQAGEIQENE